MRTYEYLIEIANREKRAALEQKLRGMDPADAARFLLQRGVPLDKYAQASFLGQLINTGSGLMRNLGVARAGLQAAERFTGQRGLGYTLGSLLSNPQASGALSKAVAGGFGDFGHGAFTQAVNAGKSAFKPGGSFTGLGERFLGASEQLANSVNQFGREAFGRNAYQGHMLQRGFNVTPPLKNRFWDFMTKQRGPWAKP
jgi:hypothetical protein